MQEGISFMCSAEIPVVMLNISRGGPGVGGIQPGQADYRQATKGGGNGDYHVPVFAPASVQESVDLIYDAIPIAERYRNPVMILADGMLGQMMEPVTLPEHRAVRSEAELLAEKPWALNGHGDKRERMVIQSLHLKPEELEAHNMHLEEKYQSMRKELPKYQIKNCKDAEIVFVAFGTMSRIVNEAIDQLKTEGITAGLIRPITLWPFPEAAFDEIDPSTKVVISTELAIGQMMEDVKSAVAGRFPVELIYRTGGMVPTPMEVARRAKQILEAIR